MEIRSLLTASEWALEQERQRLAEVAAPVQNWSDESAFGHPIGEHKRLLHDPLRRNFEEPAYLAANPDVSAAVSRGDLKSGFAHYILHGRAEGRPLRPPESSSETDPLEFDEAYYLAANPDVNAAVLRGDFRSGLAHYRDKGRVEGRAVCSPEPSPETAPLEFDEVYYLAANPDVNAAVLRGDFRSGLAHYRDKGRVEGRATCAPEPPLSAEPDGFDEGSYLTANQDVKAAVLRGEFKSGLAHYLAFGRAERRPLSSASSFSSPISMEQLQALINVERERVDWVLGNIEGVSVEVDAYQSARDRPEYWSAYDTDEASRVRLHRDRRQGRTLG